jgi:hypothetical protein
MGMKLVHRSGTEIVINEKGIISIIPSVDSVVYIKQNDDVTEENRG